MKLKIHHIVIAAIIMLAAQAIVLFWLGNSVICPCGVLKLWEAAVKTSENSQHMFDWYSLSHIMYGFILYFGLWLANKKLRWPVSILLLAAVAISVGWELFENTKFVVGHYQDQPLSLEYYGDSVMNSLVDTLCVAAGFLLASVMPVWAIVLLAVAMEITMAANVRDSVILNVVMFTLPLKPILNWQAALSP